MKADNLILDSEIDGAFGKADFGQRYSKRELVNNGLLKFACGYETGHTMKCILMDLVLITPKGKLTKRGTEYLWAVYSGELNV